MADATATTASTAKDSYTSLLAHLLSTHPIPLRPLSSTKPHLPPARLAALELHPCLETLLHVLNNDLASAHFLVRHMQSPPRFEGMLLHALLHRVEGDLENARAWYRDVKGSEVMRFVWGEGGSRSGSGKDGRGRDGMGDDADQEGKTGNEKEDEDAVKAAETLVDRYIALRKKSGAERKSTSGSGGGGSGNQQQGDVKDPPPAATTYRDEHANEDDMQRLARQEVERLSGWCVGRLGTEHWADARDVWVADKGKIKEAKEKQNVGGEGWRVF